MYVHLLKSPKIGQPAVPSDILSCGVTTAQLIPSTVKNDDFNRKLQRAAGPELPDEWSDPILMFAPPYKWIRLSTALRFGRVVNVETGEAVTQ
jgi:hypothetical protein